MRRLLTLGLLLLLAGCGDPPPPQAWRSDDGELLARVERLASTGETVAAEAVMKELLARPSGPENLHDRGRMALIRGLLAADRPEAAEALLTQVPWADKSPTIASEIIGLGLRIHWRGMLDADGRLRSGVLPPVLVEDSDQGQPGGPWQDRSRRLDAIESLLAGGARMVEREGGRVPLPVGQDLLDLARFAHGRIAPTGLRFTPASDPAVALAAVRVVLEEHDLPRTVGIADELWTNHSAATQAAAAFQDLRTWQLRRRAGSGLRLWQYPVIDQRLDALAATWPEADRAAQATVHGDPELGARSMRTQVRQLAVETETAEQIADPVAGPERTWTLATSYDGLDLIPEATVVGTTEPVRLRVTSLHRGEHRVEVFRIADPAVWERLQRDPDNRVLPSISASTGVVIGPWSGLGQRGSGTAQFAPLPEGRYVATLSARGCPTVLLRSFRVERADLHVIAARDALLAWVVDRADGRGLAGEPVQAVVTLQRDAVQAAGEAWNQQPPAWRAGFTFGYLGTRDQSVRAPGQEADENSGAVAGRAAALRDPAHSATLAASTAADGTARFNLPPALVGRIYQAEVRLVRPGADALRMVTAGELLPWARKLVAWADKPVVRPGEILRFAALLRESDGQVFRMAAATVAAEIRCGEERIWAGSLDTSPQGVVDGAVVLPPAALEQAVELVIEGQRQVIARCQRTALPPVRWEFAAAPASIRAGESYLVVLRLRDAAGLPVSGVEVTPWVNGAQGDEALEQPGPQTTDLAGEVSVRIATPAGREGAYRVTLAFQQAGRAWYASTAFSATTFPFPLIAYLDRSSVAGDGFVRLTTRMPIGAAVEAVWIRADGSPIGESLAISGSDAMQECLLAPAASQRDAIAIRLRCPVLGGGSAERRLPITVTEPTARSSGGALVCDLLRTRARPGESATVALGCAQPGRDVLVVVGARDLIAASAAVLDSAAATRALAVQPSWGPTSHVQAVAWLPGRGFVTTPAQELTVDPIDRLLAVTVELADSEPRPGSTVAARIIVRDWQGRTVPAAQVVIGAVDERVYQLSEDFAPDLWRWFHIYQRPFALTQATAMDPGRVQATLWRSMVRSWQGGGARRAFGAYGGGRKRSMGASGGSRGSESRATPLVSESDPTILWLARLTTGADGTATIALPFPEAAGSYRLTARVADPSAAVLVGSVTTRVTSRRLVGLSLRAPALVAAGDMVEAVAEVLQLGSATAAIRVGLPDGERILADQEPGLRRSLPFTIPAEVTAAAGSASGAVVRIGDVLGRILWLSATAAAAGDQVRADHPIVVAIPGHPVARTMRVVAEPDGRIRLPRGIPVGAGVELAVRAWPDAAARRAQAIADGRSAQAGPVRAMAWLLSPSSAQRRSELAAIWPTLDQSPAALVVRLAAARRNEAASGLQTLPEGLQGDWIAARARADGLALAAPRLRGVGGLSRVERAYAAVTAIAEGWAEAPAQWDSVITEVLALDDPLAMAVALDGARLKGDQAAMAKVAAGATGMDWSDPLVGVLFMDLLPATAASIAVRLELQDGDTRLSIDASAGARWSGVVQEGLELRTTPGALVEIQLVVQAPQPVWNHDGNPLVSLYQLGRDGYEPVADDRLIPGRPTVLIIESATSAVEGLPQRIELVLPSLLRALPEPEQTVTLVDGWERIWPLDQDMAERLHRFAARAIPASTTATTQAFLRRELSRWASDWRPATRKVTTTIMPVEAGACWSISLSKSAPTVIPVAVTGSGSAHWSGPWLESMHRSGQLESRVLRTIAPTAMPERAIAHGHPLAAEMERLLPTLVKFEWDWFLTYFPVDLQAQAERLQVLDPGIEHGVETLFRHPLVHLRGHWTQKRLQAWLVGDEPLRRFIEEERGPRSRFRDYRRSGPGATPRNPESRLASLLEVVRSGRDDRIRAWAGLPVPQLQPAPSATVGAWYAAAVAVQPEWRSAYWPWDQVLPEEALQRFGYRPDVEGWVAFVREELGLDLVIGAGVSIPRAVTLDLRERIRLDEPISTQASEWIMSQGANLGTVALMGKGLTVVRLPSGRLELRPLDPAPDAQVTLDITLTEADPVLAIERISQAMVRRGLPPLRIGEGVETSPLTLTVVDMLPKHVLSWIAEIWGAQVRLEKGEWVIRKP